MGALLFIDENINPRIATELRERGRPATSVRTEKWRGEKDGSLIEKISARYGSDNIVLVTSDNNMPSDHPKDVARVTVAVVDPIRPHGYTLMQWRRDVVHRWAHVMQQQDPRTVKRYGLSQRDWTPRVRRSRTRRLQANS